MTTLELILSLAVGFLAALLMVALIGWSAALEKCEKLGKADVVPFGRWHRVPFDQRKDDPEV